MNDFCIGIPGELSSEQYKVLGGVGVRRFNQVLTAYGEPPIENWEVARTLVRVAGEDGEDAKARVAEALDLDTGDLTQHSAEFLC